MSIIYKGREIKYIASDLDGTLLFDEGHELEQEVYDVIEKIIDKDVLFIVASGRTYTNELEIMEPLKDKISFIASNGVTCYHKGKQLFDNVIDKEHALKIFELVNEKQLGHLFVSCNSQLYSASKDEKFIHHMNEDLHLYMKLVDDLNEINQPIDKISIFNEDGYQSVLPTLKDGLPDIKVVSSGNQWIDFLPFGVNKGNALKHLLNEVGLQLEDGMAFGDQDNDIEMVKEAGIGFGMKTGTSSLKASADEIVDSAIEKLKEIVA
ncbi:HAD family hydrolase [Floccifex sp.]|uniref:HAD family hydrolase n=1 Tax=Floccifex sp. TaxID=2815810 RepID=UPI003F06634E